MPTAHHPPSPLIDDAPTSPDRTIRIGTRGSALAMAQATLIAGLLNDRGQQTELVQIRTQGDADKTSPLAVIGGQGVFTSALQVALLRDEIDLAVHSAKDLPTVERPELRLVAFLSRQDARDVLISADGCGLADLPHGARVGTSSRRRIAQLRSGRPDVAVVDLRGNIDTRIRRAAAGDLDAVILAAAGLHRMGWQDRITEYLPLDRFVPAPGQAALAVEIRRDDADLAVRVAALDEPEVSRCLLAERAFLRAIGAGCTTPIGAHARLDGDSLELRAMIASSDLVDVQWRTERLDPADEEGQAGRFARDVMADVRASRRERRGRSLPPVSPPPIVLVTRPEPQATVLADAMAASGIIPFVAPMLVVTPDGLDETRAALDRVAAGALHWVVFTSANAVDGVLAALGDPRTIANVLSHARVAAVGQGTAERLIGMGTVVDLVPERADASGLVAALVATGIEGRSIWVPQGKLARPELATGLTAAGANVMTTWSYRVNGPAELADEVRSAIMQGSIDAMTFASPSSASHLVELIGPDIDALREIPAICIGETTAARVRELGLIVGAVADAPSDAGLVAATWRLFTPSDRPELTGTQP